MKEKWSLRVPKGLRILASLLLASGIFFLALAYFMRPRTPAIRNAEGEVVPESIASLEKVSLGGQDQWILIRGRNRFDPILLFVHGGPGMPMMYLAHTFQRPLEDKFVCVQWDQRGAGKSFDKNVPVKTLSVKQILSDAHELILLLRKRFGQKTIYLVGHSWGSYLGMLMVHRHPELFTAYIGVGQVVDNLRAREIIERFIRQRAIKTGNEEAIQDLADLGPGAHEKWLFKFGGELYRYTNYMPFIWAGIKSPEYGLFDIPKVSRGSGFSSRHMKYNAIDGPLMSCVLRVEVPVYFFTGRHDYTTPFELVELYHESLEAPLKKIVWFDESAHFPFFEEPKRFARMMNDVLAETSDKED